MFTIKTRKEANGTYSWTIAQDGQGTGWNPTKATMAIGARVQAGPWLREAKEAAEWIAKRERTGGGHTHVGMCDGYCGAGESI